MEAVDQGKRVEDFHWAVLRNQVRRAHMSGYIGGASRVEGTGYLAETTEARVSYRAIVEL